MVISPLAPIKHIKPRNKHSTLCQIYILEVIWETKCSPSSNATFSSKSFCAAVCQGFPQTPAELTAQFKRCFSRVKRLVKNPNSNSTQNLGFFSLNEIFPLFPITKSLDSNQNKMNCHHYAMDHFSLTILYVSSCRFVSFHNKCIILSTCCISC